MKCTFYTDHYTVQDQKTDILLARGKVLGNLYVLDKFTFVANDKPNDSDCNKFLGNKKSVCNKESICKIATSH